MFQEDAARASWLLTVRERLMVSARKHGCPRLVDQYGTVSRQELGDGQHRSAIFRSTLCKVETIIAITLTTPSNMLAMEPWSIKEESCRQCISLCLPNRATSSLLDLLTFPFTLPIFLIYIFFSFLRKSSKTTNDHQHAILSYLSLGPLRHFRTRPPCSSLNYRQLHPRPALRTR